MKKHYDVIIVGGGVIGGSIAYYSAKMGREVLLLDSEQIASGTSKAAAGMLGAQSEMTSGALFELAMRSRAMFAQLVEELHRLSGVDVGLIEKGVLRVAQTPEDVERYKLAVTLQQEAGGTAEWLSPQDVREMESQLSGPMLGAMYIPQDGQLLAPQLTTAFIKSASVLGAEVRERAEATSLIIEHLQVTGVATKDNSFSCDQVVIASGVGGKHLLTQAGLELNIYPEKGECFSVDLSAVQSADQDEPLLNATVFSEGCYIVPKADGTLIVGATSVAHCYERTVNMKAIHTLKSRAQQLIPSIAALPIYKTWAGLRPRTVDGLPFIGEAPQCRGLFVAMGHYRNGILLSPVTGQLMSELMNQSRSVQHSDDIASELGLAPFALGRCR